MRRWKKGSKGEKGSRFNNRQARDFESNAALKNPYVIQWSDVLRQPNGILYVYCRTAVLRHAQSRPTEDRPFGLRLTWDVGLRQRSSTSKFGIPGLSNDACFNVWFTRKQMNQCLGWAPQALGDSAPRNKVICNPININRYSVFPLLAFASQHPKIVMLVHHSVHAVYSVS